MWRILRFMSRTCHKPTIGSLLVRRSLLVLTLLVGASIGTTSRAQPKLPSLKGRNIIEFSESASISVFIPRDVEVDTPAGNSAAVSVERSTDLTGFVLVQRDASEPLVVIGGRLPTAAGERDFVMPISNFPDNSGQNLEHFKNYPDATPVPAGEYELFVFSESGGGKIRLNLNGLKGTARLFPQQPTDVDIQRPEPRALGGAGTTNNLYSGGSSTELASGGLLFSALWLEHGGYIGGQFGFCHYEGGSEVEPLVFVPGCPNGRASAISNNRMVQATPGIRTQMIGWSSLPPGLHAQGAWYAAEAMVDHAGYVTVALNYG